MKKRSLFAMLLCAAVLTALPSGVLAAKKTVYVIESITYKDTSGRTVDTIKYTYNKNGLVTKRVWKQPGGTSTDTFIYDKDLHLVKKKYYKDYEKYTFKDGLLVRSKIYNKQWNETQNLYYEYDENGRLVYLYGDNMEDTRFFYDKNGRIIKKSTLGNYENAKTMYAKYTLDKKGNVTKLSDQNIALYQNMKNTYVKGTSRLSTITVSNTHGKKICTEYLKYKKMKVSKKAAAAVKRQQVQDKQDPIYNMFPF